MTEKNWREMEAGRELDRKVAEQLGWTAFKREESDPNPFDGSVSYYYYTGLTPEHSYRRMVPRYSTDIGAALGLYEGHDWDLETTDDRRGRYMSCVGDRIAPNFGDNAEYADTPALAVTRAWLAYMEAQADD